MDVLGPGIHNHEDVLHKIFGLESYRPFQREVIETLLSGKDCLAVLPTGGGKSLCYQIPGLCRPGLTLVISPLISLMADQLSWLEKLGIPSATLNSTINQKEYKSTLSDLRKGVIRLLYAAPETLASPWLRDFLSELPLQFIAVDEAHCISQWGHDFRPEYREIRSLRTKFPSVPCLALTATATPGVQRDIMRTLGMEKGLRYVADFDRPNIHFSVLPRSTASQGGWKNQVYTLCRKHKDQSGIIYCMTRKRTEELAVFLQSKKLQAMVYHAGLADKLRKKNQKLFLEKQGTIVVATIAFGMGINKPDVRFVIHADLPKTLENYYQEVGRAGRDGEPAAGYLLYSYSDVFRLKQIMDLTDSQGMKELYKVVDWADGQTCRRAALLNHFGQKTGDLNCTGCDVCVTDEDQKEPVKKKNGVSRTQEKQSRNKTVNRTIEAQKFLSCVYRTGQRFGTSMVVNVLLGSRSQVVREKGFTSLTTYGIGIDRSRQWWTNLSQALEFEGYVERDEHFSGLRLTDKARIALKNRQEISLPSFVEPE